MKKTNSLFMLLVLTGSFFFFSCKESGKEYTFELNLNKGDEFLHEVTVQMEVGQIAFGQTVTQPTTVGIKIHYLVDEANEDNYIITAAYERVIIKTGLGLFSISFDSDYDDDPLKMGHVLKAMTGKPITMTVDKHGKLTSIKGYEEIMTAFQTAFKDNVDEKYKGQIGAILDGQDNIISSMDGIMEQLFFYIPEKAVKVGDAWEINTNLNKQLKSNNTSTVTLKSVKNNIAEFNFEGDISTGAEPEVVEMEGMKTQVSLSGKQKGQIKVDAETGWPSEVEINQEILTVLTGDGMNIEQKITVKTTIVGK